MDQQPPAAIQISTTCETLPDAEKLAALLLEKKLAACVQIHGPVCSRYWWKTEICSAQEYVLTAKSTRNRYHQIEDILRCHHPYQVPEIIALPLVEISSEYHDWLKDVLGDE